MKPVIFKEANRVLGPPEGKDDVLPLHVYSDGNQCISCWEFTDDEIDLIVKNKRMFISVFFGSTQPPILPMVQDPFHHTSEMILICGSAEGVTMNGRNVFSKAQVDNETYKQAWGKNTPISNWLARKIIMVSVGDEVAARALDTTFREMFLDRLKQGEEFNIMVDIKRFIKDSSEGKVQPPEAYFFTAP